MWVVRWIHQLFFLFFFFFEPTEQSWFAASSFPLNTRATLKERVLEGKRAVWPEPPENKGKPDKKGRREWWYESGCVDPQPGETDARLEKRRKNTGFVAGSICKWKDRSATDNCDPAALEQGYFCLHFFLFIHWFFFFFGAHVWAVLPCGRYLSTERREIFFCAQS